MARLLFVPAGEDTIRYEFVKDGEGYDLVTDLKAIPETVANTANDIFGPDLYCISVERLPGGLEIKVQA